MDVLPAFGPAQFPIRRRLLGAREQAGSREDRAIYEIPNSNVLGGIDARIEISPLEDFLADVASNIRAKDDAQQAVEVVSRAFPADIRDLLISALIAFSSSGVALASHSTKSPNSSMRFARCNLTQSSPEFGDASEP
jgi:hypothetical protein